MKKLWAIILSCVMICSLITPVSATTENNGQIIQEETIDTKNFTFTAETGTTTSNGQGYGAYVPSGAGRYRFDFIKYYVIHTKRIDVYQYSEYKYSYYIHDPQYSLSQRWVKL